MPVLDDILEAVATAVEGLALTRGGRTIPVLRRKSPVRRTDRDPPEMIIVTKSRPSEKVSRWSFTSNRTDYYIEVVIILPTTGPSQGEDEIAEHRQAILDLFDSPPLEGVPEVFDVLSEPLEYLVPENVDQQWDYQAVRVTASVVRAR